MREISSIKIAWWDFTNWLWDFLRWNFYWRWAVLWRGQINIRSIMPASSELFAEVLRPAKNEKDVRPVCGWALVDFVDWGCGDPHRPPHSTRREVVPLIDYGAMAVVIPPYGQQLSYDDPNDYEIVGRVLTRQEVQAEGLKVS